MENPFEYLHVSTLDYDQMFKKVYGSGGLPLDETVFDRIRYFMSEDFGWRQEEAKPFFVVLETAIDEKIIGVIKLAKSDNHPNNPNLYYISYFSIDLEYRNRGYSRIMAEELFRSAKLRGVDLEGSRYTVLGKMKLQSLLNEMAIKHDVKFEEKVDYMHDGVWMYDENLVHVNEKKRFDELKAKGINLILQHPKHPKKVEEVEPVVEKKKGFFDSILQKLK